MSAGAKRGRARIGNALDGAFGFAADALGGTGRIEMIGNREALVDGCKGVLEYSDTQIKLSLGKIRVTFSGTDLTIRSFDRDHAELQGLFKGIQYG